MASAGNGTYSAAYLAESKTTLVNAFYSIPIPLEIFSTTFRLWEKLRPQSEARFTYDDCFMIFATIVAVAECISGLVYGAPYGLGRHIQAVSKEDTRMFLKGDYIFSHFYNTAIATTKLSVLSLYHRIFATPRFRLLVLCTASFVLAWYIVIEIVLGFGCRPIRAWWGETEGKCVNKVDFTYFTNVTNLVADLWIFAIPIPIILRLQCPKDKRISLCFLFSIGLGTCAISAARLSFVFGVGSPDFLWYEASLGILSAWEPCGGILCANLPLVYRSVLKMMSKAKATVLSITQSRTGRSTSSKRQPKSKGANGDWTRIKNNGFLGSGKNCTITEVSVDTESSESRELNLDGIVVKHVLRQHSSKGSSEGEEQPRDAQS